MRSACALARIAVLAVLLAAIAGVGASPASASLTNPKHFFWAPGQDPTGTVASLSNDIIYHGGSAGTGAIGVETNPAVYLVYWGTEWASGFTTADDNGTLYSSKTLQNYVNSFMANVVAVPGPACRRSTAATSLSGRRAAPEFRAPTTSPIRSVS
jgi:hypothetical protein